MASTVPRARITWAAQLTWFDHSGPRTKRKACRPDEDKVRELLVENGWLQGELSFHEHYENLEFSEQRAYLEKIRSFSRSCTELGISERFLQRLFGVSNRRLKAILSSRPLRDAAPQAAALAAAGAPVVSVDFIPAAVIGPDTLHKLRWDCF